MSKNNDIPVVVITGAASGIGLAIAKRCMEMKKHVVMADIDASHLSDQAERLRHHASTEVLSVVCDVTRPESVKNLAEKTMQAFNRIDWLFNNAGISGRLAPLWELHPDEIRNVVDVNLYGVLNGIHAFLPIMFNQSHRSRIINMASLYGLCSGSKLSAYAMSKHAIVALSESLYFDLQYAQKPLDVSVVCPSFANTQLLSHSLTDTSDKFHEMMAELIERSRPAEDVAKHILQAIDQNIFYILPDREVKEYVGERTNALINQNDPHQNNIEKMIMALTRRINYPKSLVE